MLPLRSESELWKSLRRHIPVSWSVTRVENRLKSGIPDVFICAEGIQFWIELKITKNNRLFLSPLQVSWNFTNWKAGGVNFILVHPVDELRANSFYLFSGNQGPELVQGGLRAISLDEGRGISPILVAPSPMVLMRDILPIARNIQNRG